MENLRFNNGDKMPSLGLGTWKSEPGEVKQAVMAALITGYRHIDCAAIYGNEREVGEGLQEAMDQGLVKREELWITSKLWNDNHREEDVKEALQTTLNELGLQYLDLYLIHWPIAFKPGTNFPNKPEDFIPLEELPIIETWRGMEQVQEEGLTRHIGVSNFSLEKLTNLIAESEIKPEMNQVELHPYLQQSELLDYCQRNDINVTAYSPLGSMDRPNALKKDNEPVPMDNETIQKIATQQNASPAQVLLAWGLKRGTAVIPKSTNENRIVENIKATNLKLSDADMMAIRSLDRHYRFVDAAFFAMEGNSYTMEQIWDEDAQPEIV